MLRASSRTRWRVWHILRSLVQALDLYISPESILSPGNSSTIVSDIDTPQRKPVHRFRNQINLNVLSSFPASSITLFQSMSIMLPGSSMASLFRDELKRANYGRAELKNESMLEKPSSRRKLHAATFNLQLRNHTDAHKWNRASSKWEVA